MTIYELPADKYNEALASKIEQMPEFAMPEWALYIKRIVGVGRLRGKYGGRKNRGVKPENFAKASGKIIRTMLQQAEKAGFLEKVKEGKRFGRRLTKSGKDLLEGIK